MFVYRYVGFVPAFVYPVNQSCPDLCAMINVQSSLLSVCFYRHCYKFPGTFHCRRLWYSLTHVRRKLPSCVNRRLQHFPSSRVTSALLVFCRHVGGSGADAFPLGRRRGTCSGERTVRDQRRRTNGAGERSLCAAAGPSAAHRGRGNKRQCAGSSDTKPGHAEIMRPAQWVANKRGALLILHQLIFTAHLNPSLEFDKFSRKMRGPWP